MVKKNYKDDEDDSNYSFDYESTEQATDQNNPEKETLTQVFEVIFNSDKAIDRPVKSNGPSIYMRSKKPPKLPEINQDSKKKRTPMKLIKKPVLEPVLL